MPSCRSRELVSFPDLCLTSSPRPRSSSASTQSLTKWPHQVLEHTHPDLGNLKKPKCLQESLHILGSLSPQPTGPHTQSVELNLGWTPHHSADLLLFFLTHFYNQKILNALPIAKQKLPDTDVSEREKQRVLSTSAANRRPSGMLGRREGGLSSAGEGTTQGLCRVKGNI